MALSKKKSIGCGCLTVLVIVIVILITLMVIGANSLNNAATKINKDSNKATKAINAWGNDKEQPTNTTKNAGSVVKKQTPAPIATQQNTNNNNVANNPTPIVTQTQVTKVTNNQQPNTATQTNNNNGGGSNFNSNGVVKQLGDGYDHAKLHSGPSSSSYGYDLSPGTQVQILGESNEFYNVELSNGTTGYIYAPFVTRTN